MKEKDLEERILELEKKVRELEGIIKNKANTRHQHPPFIITGGGTGGNALTGGGTEVIWGTVLTTRQP